MEIVKQSHIIETQINGKQILKTIEKAGRTAYKSEHKITEDSAEKFVRMLLTRGHESVFEHVSITVKFITDRAIANELVRHRIASYTQESTRYVAYDKHDNIQFIDQEYANNDYNRIINNIFKTAEKAYLELRTLGIPPQFARAVLPLGLKTEIIVTANIREWRHILKLRTAPDAHPLIRKLMIPLLLEFKEKIPVLFDDINIQQEV